MSKNKVSFDERTRIGQNSSEADDEFLIECFVDHPSYSLIDDTNNSKMLLVGSTGTGKTALLKK